MNFYKSQDLAERMATLKTAEALTWGLAIDYEAVPIANGWFCVKAKADTLPTAWQIA